VLLWAAPALAINTTHFPSTLMDSTCTDTEDTPAPVSGGSTRPAVQLTGTADGFCDHDSRIVTGAVTADTNWDINKKDCASGFIHVDANTVSNDTDTWQIKLLIQKPHDLAFVQLENSGSQAVEGVTKYAFGQIGVTSTQIKTVMNVVLPAVFRIQLDVVTATSWAGNISLTCMGQRF